MKIAVIGNGNIGEGLGRAWAKAGHEVVFGSRDPGGSELKALCQEIGARAAAVGEAAKGAEVVALAVPYGALDAVLHAAGDLAGKVVIDCTNAVEPGMKLKFGGATSAAEELQKRLPGAKVFKSFNAQGAENLADPVYGGVKATNFFCGDDAAGKAVMKRLVEDIGFDAVDAGPLSAARYVEPLMLLWVTSSRALGTRDLAFKLLRR